MNPISLSVDEPLTCIPFFDVNERPLPAYITESADVDGDFNKVQW